MITLCLKFPDKETAHRILYAGGEPIYINLADDNGEGLVTERHIENGEVLLIRPSDGSYCADLRIEDVPEALEEYLIYPMYRKHKFFGE